MVQWYYGLNGHEATYIPTKPTEVNFRPKHILSAGLIISLASGFTYFFRVHFAQPGLCPGIISRRTTANKLKQGPNYIHYPFCVAPRSFTNHTDMSFSNPSKLSSFVASICGNLNRIPTIILFPSTMEATDLKSSNLVRQATRGGPTTSPIL